MTEVANSLSITTPETLRRWVVQAKIDRGLVDGPTTEELAEIKALRKEVADQQRTIEILKAATTFSPRRPTRGRGDVAFIDAHRDRFPVAVDVPGAGVPRAHVLRAKARPVSRACDRRCRPQDDDLGRVDSELLLLWGAPAAQASAPPGPPRSRVAPSPG